MIEAQNLRGLEDPDTHICGFMAAKWTNTSPEQPMGAINLVWAIHHFPYHLKMSFGPARRLGLGSLGRDNGTRYPDPSVALDPNSLLREVVEAKVVLNGKPHHNLLKTGLTQQLMRYNHEHVSIHLRVRASINEPMIPQTIRWGQSTLARL